MKKGIIASALLGICLLTAGLASGSQAATAISTSPKPPSAISDLSIGAAKVKIQFPDNFFPYTSFRGRFYTGVHDDLYARAILVSNKTDKALFISVDTGDLSDAWVSSISALSGVPESNIYLTATHTHEAPYINRTYYETTLKDVDKSEAFSKNAWKAVSQSVQKAMAGLQPGRMSFGAGQSFINVNRDYKYTGQQSSITSPYITDPNPHGISDKTVAVVKFEDLAGQPLAYFINYAVHGVVMYQSKVYEGGMLISGDLPGATCRYVEERSNENVVALWTLGAAADQIPQYQTLYDVFDAQGNISTIDSGTAGYTLLNLQAQALGAEVLRVAGNMKDFTSKAAVRAVTKTISVPGKKKWDENPNTLPKNYQYTDADPVKLRLGLVLINNSAFVGFPGELTTSVGLALKKALAGMGCDNAVIVTQCNGSNGYFSDDDGYAKQVFNAIASYTKAGYDKMVINTEKDMVSALRNK
jgi:neutral ceramidase